MDSRTRPIKSPAATAAAVLQVVAPVVAGMTVGVGGTILVLNSSALVFERTIAIGIAAGLAAFCLFVLLRVSFTRLMRKTVGNADTYQAAVRSALMLAQLGKPPLDEQARQASNEVADHAAGWLKQATGVALAYMGAAAAVGIAVTIVGSVVSMAAVNPPKTTPVAARSYPPCLDCARNSKHWRNEMSTRVKASDPSYGVSCGRMTSRSKSVSWVVQHRSIRPMFETSYYSAMSRARVRKLRRRIRSGAPPIAERSNSAGRSIAPRYATLDRSIGDLQVQSRGNI